MKRNYNSICILIGLILTFLYLDLSSCQYQTDEHVGKNNIDGDIKYEPIRFLEVDSRKFEQLLRYKFQISSDSNSILQSHLLRTLQADLPNKNTNTNWNNLSYIEYLEDYSNLLISKESYSALLNLTHSLLDECDGQLRSQSKIDIIMKEELLDHYLFKCSSQYSDSWYLKPKVGFPAYIGNELLAYDSKTYENLLDKELLKPFHLTEENEVGYDDIDEPTIYYFVGPELTRKIHLFLTKRKDESKSHELFFNMFSRAINGESIIIVDL